MPHPVHVRRRLRAQAIADQLKLGELSALRREERKVLLIPGLSVSCCQILHARAQAREAREWSLKSAHLRGELRSLLGWHGLVPTERRWMTVLDSAIPACPARRAA